MKIYLSAFLLFLSVCLYGSPLPVTPTALLVVGNTNLNSGDLALKNRLQILGYTVTVKSASSSTAGDATGKSLVIISATVSSTDITTKFTNVAVPLINCESALFDDLEMTATATSNYGTQNSLTQVKITNAGHLLAAGLPNGNTVIYSTSDGITWGKPNSNALKIATLTGDAQKISIFGFEAGAMMDGLAAPARRVGFFLKDDGAGFLSANGIALLDAAILWAANLSVQNLPPTVAIASPANSATFPPGGDIQILATADDSDGDVAVVHFYSGNNLLAADSTSPYSYLWEAVPAGNYSITARAFDNENDSASASINISVELPNPPPSAAITSPVEGAAFIAPAEILITANAADSNGSIVKVEFYSGNNLLGVDFTSDYSFIWTNVAAGNYTLKAVATADGGKTTTSATVNIFVEGTTSIPQKYVLLVVGNTTLNGGDNAIKTRLESLNFVVTVKADDAAIANDAAGKNLVFISSTITSDDVEDAFTNVAVPVINCESGLFADLKMTGGSGNYGSQGSQKQIALTNSAHPLAAGLSAGNISLYPSNQTIPWGKPTANAITVATIVGTPTKAAIFGYETGAAMQGLNAPARRVGFFLHDNSAASLTADGGKLFDAVINWAANTTVVVPQNIPPTSTITAPANNSEFIAPAIINITATASDNDGNIAKVEFYEGNNLLGTDLTSPYSFAWNNISSGNFTLKTKAFDDDGATAFSSAITISVNEQPVDTAVLPFTVSVINPQENSFFLENSDITISAEIEATGTSDAPYLKVTNAASSWKKLKMGYSASTIYGSNYNVTAGGNNVLKLTLRDFTGTAQWNKIQFKPNGSSKSPSSLQTYVTAAGGIGNEWKTITIPLSAFPGFDFTAVKYIEFPSCIGAAAFEIGIQKIEFAGGSAPFLWFGDTKTENAHDGKGESGQLLVELITSSTQNVRITKVEFYRGNTLLGTDMSSPYSFNWNTILVGNYTLTARAYQSTQFVASSPVHISVEPSIDDTLKIILTFNSAPSSYSVEKAPLKYNKDFAYSYTMDDGHMDGYRIAYRMFNGGLNEYDNIMYPGMFYTDGCGNNIPFKAGLAWYSRNNIGQDLHKSRSTDNRITWAELIELHAAGWDVLNHSFTHSANDTDFSYDYQVNENVRYVDSLTGIDMTHFVVPAGDENYVHPAFNNGMIAVYDQSGSGFYDDIVQVDAALDLNDFKLKRQFIQNGTHNQSNVTDHIDEAASLSGNGDHYWYNDATHNMSTDFNGNLIYPTFKFYAQYVDNTFGKNGSDRIWMAPLQEVYEYLAVKQTTVLSSQLKGNQLEISLLLHNVPDGLRRYALTLNINANKDFNSVQVIGTSNYCFHGTGNNKLINLDWTANHSNKSFKTSPENELSSSASEEETFQMDISPNPAIDFITVKFTNHSASNVNLAVIDMLGKNILSRTEKLQKGNTQVALDLSNLNSGCYFIKAWTEEDAEQIEKFVKR